MEREIKLIANKYSSHQEAEASGEDLWRKLSYVQRLDEWLRLFNMYCQFKGITKNSEIRKVVTKRKGHAF